MPLLLSKNSLNNLEKPAYYDSINHLNSFDDQISTSFSDRIKKNKYKRGNKENLNLMNSTDSKNERLKAVHLIAYYPVDKTNKNPNFSYN